MATSHWHRWQLTAPAAALSRPIRTRALPDRAEATGPTAAAGAVPDAEGLPVWLGTARAQQRDATSCGSAVLVMLAATGDPGLARWLDTGRLPDGPRPPEIPADGAPGASDAAGRFAAAQAHVQERTRHRALGPVPWPTGLGTPPWTAAREARFPGVRYRVRVFDDAADQAATVLGLVEAATLRGHPVPFYVGGDVRGGITRALPRHVVLAVPPPRGTGLGGALQIYEPAAGSVFSVHPGELLDRREPHPALGGWTHVMMVLLPVPA